MLYGDEENARQDVLKANVLRQASEAIAKDERHAGCVLQAIRYCLKVLGRKTTGLNTLVTDEGAVLDLACATPSQQLKRYVRAAYELLNDLRIWQKADERGLVQGEPEDFNTLALRRTMASKRVPAAQKRKLIAKLWNVLPTADMAAEARLAC